LRFPDPPLAFQSIEIIVLSNQTISMGDNMAKKTFTVVIEKDPESGWLVGEVVELPDATPRPRILPGLRLISRKPSRPI
jgi:hypothetical protein